MIVLTNVGPFNSKLDLQDYNIYCKSAGSRQRTNHQIQLCLQFSFLYKPDLRSLGTYLAGTWLEELLGIPGVRFPH